MVYRPAESIEVLYSGLPVGMLAPDPLQGAYVFEYFPRFAERGLQLAPLTAPTNSGGPLSFPHLSKDTFFGLPAFISDSLPDAFGNALIDNWMAAQGVAARDITPLDRLAYLGKRAMGALEFKPALKTVDAKPTALEMKELVETARSAVQVQLPHEEDAHKQSSAVKDNLELSAELAQLIAVGTSAGGARAKAVVGFNASNETFVSGQFALPKGYEHWLLKFDVGLPGLPQQSADYGRIEYAYARMAQACGINMAPCMLYETSNRAHFMTKRFDRLPQGGKVHMQTLCAMAQLDFRQLQTHDYNQLFMTIEQLGLGYDAIDEAFVRMVFNVAAANNDDHTKNHSFLMDSAGTWSLAPAYDLTHAYNAQSPWVSKHLMSVNGRFEAISRSDLLTVANRFNVASPKSKIDDVLAVVSRWREFAREGSVPEQRVISIAKDIETASALLKA